MTTQNTKRTYVKLDRKNRNIRLNDAEWEAFRELLGVKWLREQIATAIAKQATPTAKSTKE